MEVSTEPGGLAAARKARGLTQKQVADRMGISQAAVAGIEARYPHVRVYTLGKYVAAMGGTRATLRVELLE